MILDYLILNKDITDLSNFKTKAISKYYFEINNREDIKKLYDIYNFSKQSNLKLLFIWWGTNLLFAFDSFEWIIIKNNLNWWKYDKINKFLESFTNESISDIAFELENSYNQKLWHRFIWLPWSIGWAVFWNAWCFGLETENNFIKAEVLDLETWDIKFIDKYKINFRYRSSLFKENHKYFIIKVFFDLSKVVEKYSSDVDNIYFREYKQPKGNSCWSFFKNPSRENSAWSLIEQVWLKWYKIWWAYFSNLHANFLISDWTASYKDLIDLIDLAKNKVKNKFDLDLISEVIIITN